MQERLKQEIRMELQGINQIEEENLQRRQAAVSAFEAAPGIEGKTLRQFPAARYSSGAGG